jgi:hypothetical protein
MLPTEETLDEWFRTRSKTSLKKIGKPSLILLAQRNVQTNPSGKLYKDMKISELEDVIHATVS